MKDIKLSKAWDIVYPVGVYYVLSNVASFLITLVVPYSNESYGFIKVLSTLFTLPFIHRIYQGDRVRRGDFRNREWKETFSRMRQQMFLLAGIVILAVCAAVVLNNLIAWTPLIEKSPNYKQVSEAFFGGRILFEILGPCILVPILEEYVFRGLVYGRLREWLNIPLAVGISAVIFGMMHMNVVQFVYAGLLGILLALCMERTGHLYGAILAHMAANTISIIRTETTWLSWMEEPLSVKISVTLALSLVFIGMSILVFGKLAHSDRTMCE